MYGIIGIVIKREMFFIMKKFARVIAVIMAIVMIASLFGCKKDAEEPVATTEPTTTEEVTEAPVKDYNPFTGSADFSAEAVGRRPVAIVVENLEPARPQWGIETPDILVEGEVEGGISRMLWLYADYSSVPEKVGPTRSARPSYVQFSELFDAIFIHWGGSHTKYEYVGGYTIIKEDKVKHFDGMKGGAMFGRDTTRSTSSEHRGIVKGKEIPNAIAEKGWRTELNEKHYPKFTFNDEVANAGATTANSLNLKFSSRTDTRHFTYNTNDSKYHSNDWKTDVSFQNVIILSTPSTYITTPYKRGGSVTYVNYNILKTEGTGYYASNGTITEINWSSQSGTLVLTDKEGKELALNKGQSYIGFCSSNNSGSVSYE